MRLVVVLGMALVAVAAATVCPPADALEPQHALAMHGTPKYGPNFTHFDYVNPDAPKGGTLRLSATGTFDTFNPFNAQGTAVDGVGMVYETLMVSSADEPFTMYGLLAQSIEVPKDRSWAIYHLRPEARWHDGQPVTAEDVVFSFNLLIKKGSPQYRFYYHSVRKVEALDRLTVKFTFGGGDNRELPLIVGQLPILPEHYWKDHDFTRATLKPPLGSGPYKIAAFEPGRYVEYARVKDYWGKDIPEERGMNNFDRIRYDYFRDPTVIREALKAGRIDYYGEFSAKEWATAYNLPIVTQGLLRKHRFLNRSSGGMQAFYMNTRRPLFQDRRVRRALAYAFDFQWTNKYIYYGQYVQPESFFAPTELASSGLPEGEELKILEPYRGRVPDAVFTTPYAAPKTDGNGWPRKNFETAFKLFAEAGWVVRDMKLVNAKTGQPFTFEFLYVSQAQERVLLPFKRNLARLGIDMRMRLVDTSQYINRLRRFNFDMVIFNNAQSLSPGNEQREYWGSAAADQPGSRNIAGIKDPVVDELINKVISAPTRESLVVRTRALDRVLLSGDYVIPELIAPYDRYLYWDKFGIPKITPLQGPSPNYWWYDPQKAKALAERRRELEK